MRICYVLPGFTRSPSGGARVVYQHAFHLRRQGHQVTVVHPLRPYEVFVRAATGPISNEVSTLSNRILCLLRGFRWYQTMVFLLGKLVLISRVPEISFTTLKMVDALEEEKLPSDLDALVATWWETAFFVRQVQRPDIQRKYYLCQHYETWGGPEELVKLAYDFKELNLICVSRWVREEIKRLHNRDARLVENGYPEKVYRPLRKMVSPILRVGYIYRANVTFKGHNILLQVMEQLGTDARFQLLIAGFTAPDFCWNNSGFIRTASLKAMLGFYQTIDILLFPSEAEGFGLPIIEAMACGTPVLSTPVGVAPDLIEDGVNSYVTADFSPEGLIQRLHQYHLMAPEARDVMISKAIEAVRPYRWKNRIDGLIAALSETESTLSDSGKPGISE